MGIKLDKDEIKKIINNVEIINVSCKDVVPKLAEAITITRQLVEETHVIHENVKRLLASLLSNNNEDLNEDLPEIVYQLIINTYEVEHEICRVDTLLKVAREKTVGLELAAFNIKDIIVQKRGKKDGD